MTYIKISLKCIYIVCILIMFSCINSINYPKIFSENNAYFENNRKLLIDAKNEILQRIKTTKNIDFDIKDLSKITKEKLSKIGINSIKIYELNVEEFKYEIQFNIIKNWNIETLKNISIRFSTNITQTKKGYHFYDNYHIDIWGQGDGFYIISDTDFI